MSRHYAVALPPSLSGLSHRPCTCDSCHRPHHRLTRPQPCLVVWRMCPKRSYLYLHCITEHRSSRGEVKGSLLYILAVPSVFHAPSIWYDDVAVPHWNPSGKSSYRKSPFSFRLEAHENSNNSSTATSSILAKWCSPSVSVSVFIAADCGKLQMWDGATSV